ncbi:MAG: hypothetical protein HY301_04205 [Verrucomicrobia bacterium]|nr:hypothetical protein [Verrucomicrobiota bacterium]
MTKSKLEIMLREAGAIALDRDFFLFGSQSLRAVCPRYPKEFPKTLEADLYPRHHPQAWSQLRQKMGRGSPFHRKHGVFLDCVDPGLATFPDGWTERLIPFRTPRTGGVTAWCLNPNDLFASKLAAWREKDQVFLAGMLRLKLAKPKLVMERIAELPISPTRRDELNGLIAELVEKMHAKKRKRRKSK